MPIKLIGCIIYTFMVFGLGWLWGHYKPYANKVTDDLNPKS